MELYFYWLIIPLNLIYPLPVVLVENLANFQTHSQILFCIPPTSPNNVFSSLHQLKMTTSSCSYLCRVVYFLEKAMATHSSTLAWKIPWMEGPGRLQSMGSLGVGYGWATSLSLFTFMHWRRKWQPTPVFLPGESSDGGAWWAAVYGVAQSRIQLKRLSSSSSILLTAFLFSYWENRIEVKHAHSLLCY